MATFTISLRNTTTSSNVYAYVTGQALDNNNALYLLQADGVTAYYPASPASTGAPLASNCAIRLGPPGSVTNATIPHLAGGRIWFSIDQPLTFLLNPGPGLVEPAVTNPSDPNINIHWGFCEFTWNNAQFFVNISYVDFVSLPIALQLTNTAGVVQHVTGMPANGLDAVCAGLLAQQSVDHAGWDSLIVKSSSGSNLRALSPNNGITINRALFQDYYTQYVQQVYSHFANTPLAINTQAQWGTTSTQPGSADILNFGTDGSTPLTFSKPSTADIFSCSSGPFAASPSIFRGALIARLAAAFNRSTLPIETATPSPQAVSSYYAASPTNHYSRIVHSVNADGRGYAFPFDDVAPDGAGDVAGCVFDGSPKELVVSVGGGDLTATPALTVQ